MLDAIPSENPAPGLLLRDVRYRKALSLHKLDRDRIAYQVAHAVTHDGLPSAV